MTFDIQFVDYNRSLEFLKQAYLGVSENEEL